MSVRSNPPINNGIKRIPLLKDLRRELKNSSNQEKAVILQRFFKTKKGEYGYGDIFLGLTVPQQRSIARLYYSLSLTDILKLLKSKIHEERFTALVLLIHKYSKGTEQEKLEIFRQYLKNTIWINNWDLVDTSTPQIVGDHCLRHQQPAILYRLARSKSLWERRISVLGTFPFIRTNNFTPIIQISKKLLHDEHDLIHKAVGWMLREAHKRQAGPVHSFLEENAAYMPRVMLRYAIEKMSPEGRKYFLLKKPSTIKNPTFKWDKKRT